MMTTPGTESHASGDAGDGGVSFLQTWTMPDAAHVAGWLQTMHARIHVLTELPGFRSMALYRGIDDRHAAVHAQWDTLGQLHAGRSLDAVRAAHGELARWGSDAGTAYLLDRIYRPRQPCDRG
jgi:heme-degrading monooxygenase HmoA